MTFNKERVMANVCEPSPSGAEGGTSLEQALADRSEELGRKANILDKARVYLSGPMDFVASREHEKNSGWRTRLCQFLQQFGTTVFDPWNKPKVVGMPHYGKEDEFTLKERKKWTYEDSTDGAKARARLCDQFWPTMHIDLRMVDTSDFLVAYCPTNVYSVGTVHEVVMARTQCKPVLMVSPPVTFPALDELERHISASGDERSQELLNELKFEAPLRTNPSGIPSMWYMALLDAQYFFDGFGFAPYMERFGWTHCALDAREERFPPKRPLLPYLEALSFQQAR